MQEDTKVLWSQRGSKHLYRCCPSEREPKVFTDLQVLSLGKSEGTKVVVVGRRVSFNGR